MMPGRASADMTLLEAADIWQSAVPESDLASIEEQRAAFDTFLARLPVDEEVRVRASDRDEPSGVWADIGPRAPQRTIIYLHGGAYALGSAWGYRGLAGRIARASGTRVFVLEYRLAPEHQFPAAIEDVFAAHEWLLSSGVTADSLIVAGDAAGAGLGLALVQQLRDAGKPLPRATVFFSAWSDCAATAPSLVCDQIADPLVTRDGVLENANRYLGAVDARNPLASPLYADLSGFPPMLLQVGGGEGLLDDSLRLAERARQSSVAVTVEVTAGAPHVFQLFAPMLPQATAAIDAAGEFIINQFAPKG